MRPVAAERAGFRVVVRFVLSSWLLAGACTSPGPPPIPTADPAGRPPVVDADAFSTRWPIKHVVFVIKENRSFDNLYGLFPGANGAAHGSDKGVIRPLTPAVDETPHDLPHTYDSGLAAINGGRMDGFSQSANSRRYAYTAFLPQDIPNYWHWAEQYVLADNFYASAQGPSFPNHLFTIAATSGGTHVNPEQPLEQVAVLNEAGFSKSWGCDIGPDGFVVVEDSEGNEERVPPCFDFLTEGDLLDGARIPWSYYAASNTQNGYIWSAYAAIARYRDDPVKWGQHVFPVDGFEQDVADGRLAPVTWVTPTHELSDHPEHSMCQGENWTTRVVNAIMRSPAWKDTAIFITWDDWGGFYDHVPPRQIDPFGYGIRVPMLVISSYARAGFVDHTEAEFSSVLRFIEDNWGLTQLTDRDRLAHDLSYDFDFTQEPRRPDALPLRTCVNPVDASPIAGD
ncbi:MAG TPA: alkaline phosphatase family protein [Actinomycetota bacterium]|jgi:phospholipase C